MLFTIVFLLLLPFSFENNQKFIDGLYKRILDEQQKEDVSWRTIWPRFQKMKGLFSSKIHFNMVGKTNNEETTIARTAFEVYDDNMFVTSFVLYSLFEAYDTGAIQLDLSSVSMAIDQLEQFRDQNQPTGTPIYGFWKEIKENGTWTQYPQNANNIAKYADEMPKFFFKLLPITIEEFIPIMNKLVINLHLATDADDTSANLVMAGWLRNHANNQNFSELSKSWDQKNYNLSRAFDVVKKYAYRPFISVDPNATQEQKNNADVIDPRTYFWIKDFIYEAEKQAQEHNVMPKLLLVNTWLCNNQDEIIPQVVLDYNVNNVDLSVSVNTLLGITFTLLSIPTAEAQQLFDLELSTLYTNVTNLITWAIKNNIIQNKLHLCLTYYPLTMDFYWFAARVLQELETYQIAQPLPFEEMNYTAQQFSQILRTVAFEQIVDQMNKDKFYWEGFLGNYDGIDRGEDRIFVTSLAVNAIIDMFTQKDKSHKLSWINHPNTQQAKTIVEKAVQYLLEIAGGNDRSQSYNAFFTGDIKSLKSLLYFFPSNLAYNRTSGISFNQHTANSSLFLDYDIVVAVKGVIPEQEYNNQLNEEWFGNITSPYWVSNYTKDQFNNASTQYFPIGFPFWSSFPMTYSQTLLAVSKYDYLNSNLQADK